MKRNEQEPVPPDAFIDLLPVTSRFVAPGEYQIMAADGRQIIGYVEGSALAEWLRDRINAAPVPRSRSKKQKIEDTLRKSDLTAQITDRQDIEYGHHESLPRGEHVSRLRK